MEQPIRVESVGLFTVVIITIILIRIAVARLLDSLVSRGTISITLRDAAIRVIDVTLIVMAISVAVLVFIPQYWGVLTVFVILGLIGVFFLIYPLSSYMALAVIQVGVPVRGKFFEIQIPGYPRTIQGKITSTTPYHTVIEDVWGNHYYIPNMQLARSVLKPSTPRIALRILVELPERNGSRLMEVDNTVSKSIGDYRHPGFKDNKGLIMVEASDTRLQYIAVFYPISTSLREDAVKDLMREVLSLLSRALGDKARSVSVSLENHAAL
ncbi:hypothetical protein [Desulfurococcus mucosus]|uniref:MscS Mechanosensitive ion channel n=1 Tax=Desulfurococcus mucosus (strain ATCC 35584 / DSM 2162 / JCM 9187 / O7/1) TaxID=765177 RepID=E8RA92_DESM0|nr:hypothetical protein [Desulfurococcus mucosus]ADV65398.1 hypothetical protein Desmu_1096 [Desulfurococcus mucosus DSM 2162]